MTRESPCVYGTELARGIDRRDSRLPYTLENSVPCGYKHNHIKRRYITHEMMLSIVRDWPEMQTCGHISEVRPYKHQKPKQI